MRSLVPPFLLLSSLVQACASNFDAKAQANSLGVDKYGPKKIDEKKVDARPPLALEPFAVVRQSLDADVLGALPALPLPIDAHIDQGRETGIVNQHKYTRRTLQVRMPGTHERFDREVGDLIIGATKPPPEIAVVFRYDVSFGIGTYNAMAVRAKPLATTSDLVNAEVIPWGKVNINLDSNEPPEETKLVAVRVTFSDEAVKRLESDADTPVAFLLDGRVVRKDEKLGKLDREHAVRLIFEWPDLNEARAVAEKLVQTVTKK